MTTPKHYPRAPITEAVLELRVRLPEGTSLSTLADLHAQVEQDYPTRRNQVEVQFEGRSGGEGPTATARQTHKGFVFISHDERQSFQARLDGFAFSRLAPYDRWETFQPEARRLWSIYRSATNPESIVRLALRYVNKLDIPLPVLDMKDYLRTGPEIAPELPQGLSRFFMQLEIPQEDLESSLVLNEALVPPPRANLASVLLDIDIFRQENVPNDEDGIWAFFERLRRRKNQVFEACITDRTKELFV